MPFHKDIAAANIHVIGYVQASDPGAIGAGKTWIDTTLGAGNWELKIRNITNAGWETLISGGGGVSTMVGLTDGPMDYTGAAGFIVTVNGAEDGFEFTDDATFALAAELALFLPLAGGLMDGPVQFNNSPEGIEFNDGADAFFNGIALDISRGAIVIGGEAVDLGVYPTIILDSGALQVGIDGLGLSTLALWEDTAADFVNIISFYDGGPLEFGYGGAEMHIFGDSTRPLYNGNQLALLSDTGGGGGGSTALDIPHSEPGDDDEVKVFVVGVSTSISGSGDSVSVPAGAFIQAFVHGSSAPVHNPPQVNISRDGGSNWSGWSSNVWDTSVTYTEADIGQQPVLIAVSDGVSQSVSETFISIADSDYLTFP